MRILWITSCPFMPSKKVITELVGKNCHTYLLCALKRPHKYREFLPTEQSRIPLSQGIAVDLHSSQKQSMTHWGTTYDQVSECNSEAIPLTPCHFTNEKWEHDQPTLYKQPNNVTYIKYVLKGTESVSSQVRKYCHESLWRHFNVNIAWPCSSSPHSSF